MRVTDAWLREFYDLYPRVEEEFQDALQESLNPRGPDLMYEITDRLGLRSGANAVDLGCGEGKHTIRLAERYGIVVRGLDPVERHLELAREALEVASQTTPHLKGLVQFVIGQAEAIPKDEESTDFVWCRDVLVHVEDLQAAFSEISRILRSDGYVLTYQTFGTERLEPAEAHWLWNTMGVVDTSADPVRYESAIQAAGLSVEEGINLTSEWGEWQEEASGKGRQRLLHASRLLRAPEKFIARFGQGAYDIMLGDCLWHIYKMIGKLTSRIYLLRKAS